jgi:hypothetical protein
MTYDWTKNPEESLDLIKENILKAMKIEQNWYTRYRAIHSVFSRSIRMFSTILFAFGILWPILDKGKTLNYGYISLAVGGLLLLLDKYLGVSSGYVRFYVAELDVKKHTQEFIENWDIETAKASTPLTKENILSLLNIVKQFRESVYTTIQVETGDWAAEFQTQTGELLELFKQKHSEIIRSTSIDETTKVESIK